MRLIILYLFLAFSLNSFSQLDHSKIKTVLVDPNDSNLWQYNVVPIFPVVDTTIYIPWIPQPGPQDPWWVVPQDFWITMWYPCGNSYHENGELSACIECNADSVMHGKARYYDENGHKYQESTYYNGQLTKQKLYDSRGRIESVVHYKKGEQGYQKKHGICTYYSEGKKEINRYNLGELDGLSEVYLDGKLSTQDLYDSGVLIDSKIWDDGENLIQHLKYDSNGGLNSKITWNAFGDTLIFQEHENGKPVGRWVDRGENYLSLTYHENGVVKKRESYQNNILIQQTFYEKGSLKREYQWWQSGGLSSFQEFYGPNNSHVCRFAEEGDTIADFVYNNDQYLGSGYFFKDGSDTLLIYEADSLASYLPIKQWIVYNGDTLREEYASNQLFGNQMIYVRNNYILAENGKYKRDGLWLFYAQNNYITDARTYDKGKVIGDAAKWDFQGVEPFLIEEGKYFNGSKNGLWTEYDKSFPNSKTIIEFQEGIKTGIYKHYNYGGWLEIEANLKNGIFDGHYKSYYENGKVRSEGIYKSGKKNGWWKFYEKDGRLWKEGEYIEGEEVGKWIFYRLKDNGKIKKEKRRMA